MLSDRSLLDLYRAARELDVGEFEEWALVWLHRAMRFDTALWGCGQLREDGSLVPHIVHLHRQPQESVDEWARINVADPVAALCIARAGQSLHFHAPTLFAGRTSSQMRSYAQRYGRQSYLVCAARHEFHPRMMTWLSLYREDPQAHFSEAEQRLHAAAMAHLGEAQQVNRALRAALAGADAEGDALSCVADGHGFVHVGGREVLPLLQREWAHASAGRLPPELLDHVQARASGNCQGRALSVRWRASGGLVFLQIRETGALSRLTRREAQVAQAIASGLSSKEAARSLDMAPETVRVHLRHAYQKLEVHGRAELGRLFGRLLGRQQAGAHWTRDP